MECKTKSILPPNISTDLEKTVSKSSTLVASAVECGNYLMMDPIAARAEAAAMLPVLEGLDAEKLHY